MRVTFTTSLGVDGELKIRIATTASADRPEWARRRALRCAGGHRSARRLTLAVLSGHTIRPKRLARSCEAGACCEVAVSADPVDRRVD